jgi:hypothetical protein
MSDDRLTIKKEHITIERISNGFIVSDHESTYYPSLEKYVESILEDVKDADRVMREHLGEFKFDFNFKLEIKE